MASSLFISLKDCLRRSSILFSIDFSWSRDSLSKPATLFFFFEDFFDVSWFFDCETLTYPWLSSVKSFFLAENFEFDALRSYV